MKSRKLLAAALASLLGAAVGVAETQAEDGAPQSRFYRAGQSAATIFNRTVSAKKTTADTATATTAAGDGCDACESCDQCAPATWFVEGEGLLWVRQNRRLPPLVTRGGTGLLGAAGVETIFGNDTYGDDVEGGGRITFGRYFGEDQDCALTGSFFMLGQSETNFNYAAANAAEVLALPFQDPNNALAQDALIINGPLVSGNGRVNINYVNDIMGADAYVRKLVLADECFTLDVLGGYQFSRVDDSLSINANYDNLQGGPPNNNVDVTDLFQAQNQFHGGTVGVLAQFDHGRWVVRGLAKCGVGNMRQIVDISGQTTTTPLGGGASVTEQGGLYALPNTNIGTYTNDELVFIPEAKLNIGYRISDNWTFSAGYSFIYWSKLLRADDVIDTRVNENFIPPNNGPGLALPGPPDFVDVGSFWAQGLNLSAEFQW